MKICLQNQKTGLPVIFRRTSLYSGGILAMTLRYLPPAIFHHQSEQTSCDDNFEKPVNGIPPEVLAPNKGAPANSRRCSGYFWPIFVEVRLVAGEDNFPAIGLHD